jgi:methionine biosynthesis protein MetW
MTMKLKEYASRYDQLAHEGPLYEIPLRKEYLVKEVGKGKKVLDLGCLGGQLSKHIKDQNNDVYGVELNAKAAAAAEALGVKVKVFDLNDGIPFEDEYFDVVHAGHILENIYDTKFLFEECNRVLKPKGTLFFTIFNLNSLENRLRILSGGYLSLTGAFPEDHNGKNIRVFNISKIKELCRHTGFQVMDIVGISATSRESIQYRVLQPLVRFVPQLGELLIVKVTRVDQ